MISNASTFKLKALKSSRDVEDEPYEEDVTERSTVSTDTVGETNYVRIQLNSRGDGRLKTGNKTTRQIEYRANNRGGQNDRRGRGGGGGGGYRGGPHHRGRDRDVDGVAYAVVRKFQEPLNKYGNDASYHAKYYDAEKKPEPSYGLPEDTRISKLLRRLNQEADQDKSLGISKKLLEVLLIPDNARYVRRSFNILSASVLDILHAAPGPLAKRQVARALGRIGYIMETDFRKFQEWLFQKFVTESDDVKVLFMKAIKETLALEKETAKLQDFSESLMGDLQTSIEATENPDVFTATLENLIALIEIYPEDFYSQFSNTVDILFGWHVDHTQPMCVIEFVSNSLQKVAKHFRINLEFSVTLIKHFLEDMDDYIRQLHKRRTIDGNKTLNKEHVLEGDLEPIIMSILAVNTVLKCLGDSFSPLKSDLVTYTFIVDCLNQIVKTATDSLEIYVPDNLIIAANDSVTLLLSVVGTKVGHASDAVYALIDLELSLTSEFSDATIISVLVMISRVIRELSANLPIELVQKLVGPQSELLKLRHSNVATIQNAVVVVYHSLLNLKNIPLLQEAYRCVLGDLEIVYKRIVPDIESLCQNNPFTDCDCPGASDDAAEVTVLFLLRCLSSLANVSGSIIGMWALQPSILELFAVNLKPYDERLCKTAPSLQYGLIYLLYSHCKCYNHFVSQSDLLSNTQTNVMGRLGLADDDDDDVSKSPSSGNLVTILSVLTKCLKADTNYETKLLLLRWFEDVLVHSETYVEILYTSDVFIGIVDALHSTGYRHNRRIVLSVCDSLERLLSNKQLAWPNSFLTSVCDLCKLHMNSNDADIRSRYVNLSVNIPWDICAIDMNKTYNVHDAMKKCDGIGTYSNMSVVLAQHWQLNGSVYGEMLPQQFKTLMKYLLDNEEPPEANWLVNLFTCCWPLDPEFQQTNSEDFRELALSSRSVLLSWAAWESAQLCVNSKLRTPLGKPNETFTSFEVALKELMRDMTKADAERVGSAVKQERVRLLLDFIECLEKSIYNASEGCALAMQPPLKPVKTFFHTNTTTCQEWLNRIRIIVIGLALHSGYSTLALRHGQAMLGYLVAGNKTKSPDFDKVLMLVSLALLNLKESEALQGFYVWSQTVLSKKLSWIKCAVDHASKKYESAADKYKKILLQSSVNDDDDDDDKTYLDASVKHFLCDQIVNCYKNLNNWKAVVEWKETEKQYLVHTDGGGNENGNKYFYTSVDLNTARVLADIEANNYVVMNELMSWDAQKSASSWSSYQITRSIEHDLYNISSKVAADQLTNVAERMDDTLRVVQSTMQENLRSLPSEFLQDYTVLHYAAHGLKNIVNNASAVPVFLVSEEFETEIKKMDSCLLSKVLWWFEYFSKLHDEGSSTFFSNLRLDIIKKARKEGNFCLANVHLHKYLQQKELVFATDRNGLYKNVYDCTGRDGAPFLENVADGLINPSHKFDVCIWTYDNSRAIIEAAKLLYAVRDDKEMVFNLCATASTGIMQHLELSASAELQQTSCKILLTLAKWIQADGSHESLSNLNTPLGRLVMILPDIGSMENRCAGLIPEADVAVGKLLKLSLHQSATTGKAWSAFGAWCYRWGRKIVDQNSTTGGQLSTNDILSVQSLLPPETNAADLQKVYDILSQTRASADEEDIDSNEINTSEMIETQLLEVPVLYRAHPDQLTALVDIWRQAQKRIYSYYELSAEAYFKYLHLSGATSGTECTTITATLRLLRLIVKHALELQTVLETGLADTPTHPWKVIIPQLFSRLNHPEGYVRRRVSELLSRVAKDAPHLIIFPAVVGAVDGGLGLKFELPEIAIPKDGYSQGNDTDDANDADDVDFEIDNVDPSRDVLHSCFMSMVETLSHQAPETIAQVQLLVKELRRITLLWDELWLGTLLQHHGEISKRLVQLELEIEKVNGNGNLSVDEKADLIGEKHRIIIKPIVFILEQLHVMTSVDAETPHEKLFQERYSCAIVDVLAKLKSPENPDKPQESWQPLKMLQSKLQQRAHKRASYTLKMTDISPVLAGMTDTVISMPGVTKSSQTQVTVASVANHVSILPTKTKPKKLVFHGSDGETYTYLFKGLEDLHLDERIMQFLSITNTMMAKNSDSTAHNLYRARHYSVIPLGPRSGLIRWVDGTVPVFSLYKRWQQREAVKTSGKQNANPSVPRPSELFYNKLNPLLQEHGVKNKENRKEWPLACVKQVLVELVAETPSNLLEKEFWCHSINAGAWWQTVRNYSYSVAVMSIIGYIIGLGDRHLDNLLVDLSSGEVVHIDYNVCFEKGKTLRVPEKVPFRMTENLKTALGVTGVEGIFRMACENVLKTMKKGRETLLTLLEAFVYDPLVDWTVGGEGLAGTTFRGVAGGDVHRQTRKDLEYEVTLAMFNVRCAEMKAEWNNNHDDILEIIPTMSDKLNKWLDEHNLTKLAEDVLQDLHQHMALIKEAEAHGNQRHPLYKLPARYATYKTTKDLHKNAQQHLEDLIKECRMHLKHHSDALGAIQGVQYNEWFLRVNAPIDKDGLKVFELVKEFLQNAGQTTMVTQCEQSEKDVVVLSQQQMTCVQNCLAMLNQYGQLVALYPASYIEEHRAVCFMKWCRHLLEVQTQNACEEVFVKFNATYNLDVDPKLLQNVVDFNYQLQVMVGNVMQRIKLNCERLALLRSHGLNNSAALDKSYADAKQGIVNFLKSEKGAVRAYEFVVINELCSLNKQYLVMETTARSAGNYLVTLTSRDGDWFLDEMLLMSSLITELVGSLPNYSFAKSDNAPVEQIINGLKIANNIYKGLQELNFNFHTVILPEAMSRVQCEDGSVTSMIAELDGLLDRIGLPLDEIVVQLEKQLTLVVLKMDEDRTQDHALDLVACVRQQYEAMLHSQSDSLSSGQMLLMGFNGLFENLNRETSNLVHTLGNLDIPGCWRKVDQVREAKALAAPIYDPKARAILDDIFLLKRLQTMSEFFGLCTDTGVSFKGVSNVAVYTDEQLSKPIKTFTADYISRQFLGIKTEAIAYLQCLLMQHLGLNVTNEIEQKDVGAENKVPLEDLCKKALDHNLKRGIFSSNILAQASSFCVNMVSAWKKHEIPKYIDDKIKMQNSTISRMQSQLTAHGWLHEHVLARNMSLINSTFKRSNFLMEMRSIANTLTAMQPRLVEARERQKNLIGSVEQRLKWAAGANPDLLEVVAAFAGTVTARERQLDNDQQLAALIAATCNTLIRHEAIRTQSVEASAFSQLFLETLEKWREACVVYEGRADTITPAEESLMLLVPCDPNADINWIQKLSVKVSEVINDQQQKVVAQKMTLFAAYEDLFSGAADFKDLIDKHHRLMGDVKTLLKSMAKMDDCGDKVQAYLLQHRRFVDRATPILALSKEDVNQECIEDALDALRCVEQDVDGIFDDLLKLDDEKACSGGRPPFVRQDGLSSPKKLSPKHEAGKGQQRNAYAVGVWRRVRMKLEGRDPDPGRKYTLQEQVDYVIKEAVNLDNLALLYEGWTPWV